MNMEPELLEKLVRLYAAGAPESERQGWADTLLARIAWSRIAEPGDGTAGAILVGLGPRRALKLLIERASPGAISAALAGAGGNTSTRALAAGLDRWLPRLNRAETLDDIDRALANGLRVATPEGPHWPAGLDSLGDHAPGLLWLRGDPELLVAPSLSVVGARAATGYGTHITAEIVDGVCSSGICIVSGAAYGIDAVAHRTALAVQAPTIAVLAGGADRAYPAAHDSLLGRIAEKGLVCAEMIPGAAPTKWRFRQRNRIIAALSPALLVTEAGLRSGTLNTAGHAAEMGRVIGAVPGPVTSAASAGCHRLIREYDAALITNARDALEMLGIGDRFDLPDEAVVGDGGTRTPPLHERVIDALPLRGSRALPEIAKRAGLGIEEVRGGLAELELLGRVSRRETPGAEEVSWALPARQ